ncbi:MAG: tetratricopeptide repeat protein, partial [Croceibacterium sp.]
MSAPEAAAAHQIDRFLRDQPAEAARRLRAVLKDDPRNADAWRHLGRALRALGQDAEASDAEVSAVRATAFEPEMIAIARAMQANDLPQA